MLCYEEDTWDMFSETPYKCLDPLWCAMTPPGSDDSAWEVYVDTNGDELKPDKGYRIGYFEASTEMYAPCLEWDQFITDFNEYKIYDGQYYDLLTTTMILDQQPITYLCWEGRAVACNMDATTSSYVNGSNDGLACIDGGDPKANAAGWSIQEGVIAEPIESFETRYPDCLPHTSWDMTSLTSEQTAFVDVAKYVE